MQFFIKIFIICIILIGSLYANSVVETVAKDGATSMNDEETLEKEDSNSNPDNTKDNDSAVDTVEMYEGEAVVAGSTFDVGKSIINATGLDKVKPYFFDKIDNNVILSQAMMNTQQETGDPEFILLARQNGIVDKDTLYLGGDAAFTPDWNIVTAPTKTNVNSINNYYMEYYFLSTLGEWTSVFGSVSVSTTNGDWDVSPGGIYFMLGNLEKSPFYGYAALSTVNYGNFDIVGNFLPTMTRLFFMQTGGNLNLSYNKDGLQTNFVFLGPTNNNFLQVSNAYAGNTNLGFTVNAKYIYDLESVGNYWYAGAAYSNLTGFSNSNNDSVGAVDFNFGMNIDKLEFINEFVFTDSGVSKVTSNSSLSTLSNNFFISSIPSSITNNNLFSSGGNVFSWSSQVDYTVDLYNKSLVPYVSYSQIQQTSVNYSAMIDTGFRYNAFADAWMGAGYSYINANSQESSNTKDNILSLYFRWFI